MTGVFQQYPTELCSSIHYPTRSAAPQPSSSTTAPSSSTYAWPTANSTMRPQHTDNGGSYSSPAGPSTSRDGEQDGTPGAYLPRQVFSSPNENLYPASTLAAVQATRARFFARQNNIHSAPRRSTTRRAHKNQPLSSASSSAYRQSFFERCQRAMDQTRAAQRDRAVTEFRRGKDGATPGLFSDEMDEDEEEGSSPPGSSQGEREEDDELTRRRVIAEYARLKRIYELKGHLEIGWIDPDQLSWLEHESRQHLQQQQQQGEEDQVDPYWGADDEELEQLWLESQSQSQSQQSDVAMMDDGETDDFDEDVAFEEALARLPV